MLNYPGYPSIGYPWNMAAAHYYQQPAPTAEAHHQRTAAVAAHHQASHANAQHPPNPYQVHHPGYHPLPGYHR